MTKYIFPSALIVLNICAAGACLFDGDIKKTIYWLAAAVLNICVTF